MCPTVSERQLGVGGIDSLTGIGHQICVSLHGLCSGPREQSGGTELPRLTSDPVCTAYRRGGIPIWSDLSVSDWAV